MEAELGRYGRSDALATGASTFPLSEPRAM